MSTVRIALAQLQFPFTLNESVASAVKAVEQASAANAEIVCFPECFVPGYRSPEKAVPRVSEAELSRAWATVAKAARQARITVILGTERIDQDVPIATALVINPDGRREGFQDKVQLAPSEDNVYAPGITRRLFQTDRLTFGIAICHEGWRYPETVRWSARRGAQIVFHPHFHEAEEGGFVPDEFADPANSFHEKALLCRAAENTCFLASVNGASPGSPTTSVIVNPDGTVLAYQPYSQAGLLVADLDLSLATGLLAKRLKDPAF